MFSRNKIRIFFILLVLVLLFPIILYFFYSSNQEILSMNSGERANASGRFIQLSDGLTHYELSGPDTGKVVVLIHGGSSTGMYLWEKNYAALVSAGFRVLRMDLYGRGYSDRPEKDQTLDLLTTQVKELVDTLRLKKPFHLAGVSLGGNIAVNMAHLYPEHVDKLVLFDPAAINPGSPRWYFKYGILGDFLLTVYWLPRAVDKQMAEFYDGSQIPEYKQELSRSLSYKGTKSVYKSAWMNILTEDCNKQVLSIGTQKRKVLLFWGKQDPVIPLKASKKYAKAIPGLQIMELDRAGHLSNFERPELVNPVMIDFLKK